MVETRAVQRRPKEERWDVAPIQALLATPWCNPAPEGGDQAPAVLPPRPEGPARPLPPMGPGAREGPKQVYIRDSDLEQYGYTANCRRCALMRDGQPARGVRHTVACRTRVEAAMAAAGDERLQQAHQRQNEEIERRMEAAEAARVGRQPLRDDLPRADDGPAGGRVADAPALDDTDAPPGGVPADVVQVHGGGGGEAGLPEDADVAQDMVDSLAVEVHVESDDDEALLDALAKDGLGRVLAPKVAREANCIYEMLLVHGVSRGDAVAKVAELYSPPRVTEELGRLPRMSLAGGPTFDLRADANGVAWDFRRADHRRRAREQIRQERPFIVIGSPPCTDFGAIQNLNRRHWGPAEVRRRRAEAMVLLGFAVEVYWLQLEAGRHFLHEHPATASSWRERIVMQLRCDDRVGEVVGDQCRYGLKTAGPFGERLPARKPTRFLSSAPAILEHLSLRCRGVHRHQPLLGGGRAGAAAIYPPGLCRAILAGAEAQLQRD